MLSIYESRRCVGEKKGLVNSVNFFSLMSCWPVEKSKRALSRAQISVHSLSAEVVLKSCLNWKWVDLLEKWLFFFGFSFYSCFFLDVSTLGSYIFIMCSVGISEPPGPPNMARCIPLKGHSKGLLNVREEFLRIIAELAERSPITIRNSSNPSSPKNLVVRPYKVLLLACVANCNTGTILAIT